MVLSYDSYPERFRVFLVRIVKLPGIRCRVINHPRDQSRPFSLSIVIRWMCWFVSSPTSSTLTVSSSRPAPADTCSRPTAHPAASNRRTSASPTLGSPIPSCPSCCLASCLPCDPCHHLPTASRRSVRCRCHSVDGGKSLACPPSGSRPRSRDAGRCRGSADQCRGRRCQKSSAKFPHGQP